MAHSEDSKTDRELIEEMAARARRLETKTTKIANHLGVDVNQERPLFDRVTRSLQVPSPKVTLEDVLSSVDFGECDGLIGVYCGSERLMTISP